MISIKGCCDQKTLRRNHRAAVRRGLPWLTAEPQRTVPLAIVGGGVTAKDFLDEILFYPGEVMAINGAYDWLQDHGRVPDYLFLLDPLPVCAGVLTRPHKNTRFIVASMCDPAVFDALNSRNVLLYRAPQGDDEWGPHDIPGGCTAITRAPLAGAILGYRHIVLYGADSCFIGDTTHAYGGSTPSCDTAIPEGSFQVEVTQRWLTNWAWLAQAEYLAEMIPQMGEVKVRMRGNHLAADLLAHGSWRRI